MFLHSNAFCLCVSPQEGTRGFLRREIQPSTLKLHIQSIPDISDISNYCLYWTVRLSENPMQNYSSVARVLLNSSQWNLGILYWIACRSHASLMALLRSLIAHGAVFAALPWAPAGCASVVKSIDKVSVGCGWGHASVWRAYFQRDAAVMRRSRRWMRWLSSGDSRVAYFAAEGAAKIICALTIIELLLIL